MDLTWIAAIFSPYEVATHPNFSDEAPQLPAAADLASVVIGRPPWSNVTKPLQDGKDRLRREYLDAARTCLVAAEQTSGVNRLRGLLIEQPPADAAEFSAFAIFFAAAASELEMFDDIESVLSEVISEISGSEPGSAFLEAAVRVQRGFRRYEAGDAYMHDIRRSAEILAELDIAGLQPIRTSAGTSRSSLDILGEIAGALWISVASFASPFDHVELPATTPSWQDLIRSKDSDILLRISRDQASEYKRWADDEFDRIVESNSITFGRSTPDLFMTSFRLELLANRSAARARADVAVMRVVQFDDKWDAESAAEIISALRRSRSTNQLVRLLKQLRDNGPVEAILRDARRVSSRGGGKSLLSEQDCAVLQWAAAFMSTPELDAILTGLPNRVSRGVGADDGASRNMLHIVDSPQWSWRAAAAIANSLGDSQRIWRWILDGLSNRRVDNFALDEVTSIAQSLRADPDQLRTLWARYPLVEREYRGTSFHLLVDGIAGERESGVTDAFKNPVTVSDVVDILNWHAHRNKDLPLPFKTASIKPVNDALQAAVAESQRGAFSVSSFYVGEVAAILYGQTLDPELASSLLRFLFSSTVPRSERTPGFDRLTERFPSIPAEILDPYRDAAQHTVANEPRSLSSFDTSWTRVYCAAVRFCVTYDMFDKQNAMELAYSLLRDSQISVRREGCRTVCAIAASDKTGRMFELLMQMTYERDAAVRAYAAEALVQVVNSGYVSSGRALDRLYDLSVDNGTRVPSAILGAVAGLHSAKMSRFNAVLGVIKDVQVSRTLRHAAAEMLRRPPVQ